MFFIYLSYFADSTDFQEHLETLVAEFNSETRYIHVGIKSDIDYTRSFLVLEYSDIDKAVYAAAIILLYCMFMLGSCSPIHCRVATTLLGFVCVLLSVEAATGLCCLLNLKFSEVHDTLPILMLGIGVDDMFVICNALDQTSFKLTPFERLRHAMGYAGPSITITSLTNAFAFLSGYVSSIPAVKSFCVVAAVTVMFLYTTVLTIFVPFLLWDTKRVGAKRRECCGACCCKEDSVLFCRGRLLSEP